MIDTEAMKREFIANRKAFNKRKGLKPGDKGYLNENPQLLVITYRDGKGAMVIDQEELMKLPKATQNKIYNI